MNLYVPEEQYFEQLTLFNESGNIDIGKIQAKEASIRISYGNLNINSFTGKNLSIEAESGNLTLDSVACRNLNLVDSYGNCFGDTFQVSGQTAINLESGNLELSRLETDSLNFSDEYGNCTIDEITLKEGDFSMESGNLVLSNALLGTSSIRNSYGIVNLELNGSTSDYNYDLTTEYGSIDFDGKYITVEEDASNIYYRKDNHQKNQIYINCESGNISIRSK